MYTPKQTAKTIQKAMSPAEVLSRDKLRRIILLSNVGGAGGSSAVVNPFPPTLSATLTYFLSGPSTCFTDAAGTVPAAAGDAVYTRVSSYGPSFTFQQASAAARPILRQNAGGKYYLEWAFGRYMVSTANVTVALNEPATLALAFNPLNMTGGTYRAYLVMGSGATGQYRSLWKYNTDNFAYNAYAQAYEAALSDGTVNQSIIATTATGAAISMYRNGVLLSGSGSTSHAAGTAAPVRLGSDTGGGTSSAWHDYGVGWRLGTGALTAGEISLLDIYQQGLYS